MLLWISDRADGAKTIHLAYVPKSGGRIGELVLVPTDRDYHTARAGSIAPKCGGRTTRVLRVFAASVKNEERPIHSRAGVRLIVPILLQTRCFGLPNSLSLSCTARAYVPKPTRHGGRSD